MIENRKAGKQKLIVAAAAAVSMFAVRAGATTWNWAAPNDGNWSDGTQWTQGTAPASNKDTALVFPSNPSGFWYHPFDDIPGAFTVNSVTITSPGNQGGVDFESPIATGATSINFAASSAGVNPVLQINYGAYDFNNYQNATFTAVGIHTDANLAINVLSNLSDYNSSNFNNNFYYSGNLSGSGTVTINGFGSMDMVNANDFTGTLVVNNTDFNTAPDPSYGVGIEYDGFTGNIGLPNASNIVITPRGSLFVGTGNATSFLPNYLPDAGAVTLKGGVFYNRGQKLSGAMATTPKVEAVGTISFAAGYSYCIIGNQDATTSSTLTGSVTRTPGAVAALMGNPGAAVGGISNSFFVSTTPVTVVGGGTGISTPTQSIVPWMIGSTSRGSSNLSNFSSFVTYDGSAGPGGSGGTGFRVIPDADDATAYAPGANVVSNFTPIAGDTTINAFKIKGNGGAGAHLATGSPASLNITSGLLILSGDGGSVPIGSDASTAETGTISFGSAEGIIMVAGQNTGDGASYDLRIPLAGSSGLTVATTSEVNARIGAGLTESLVLSTAELYTGNTTVAGGILTLGGNAVSGTISTTGNASLLSTNVTVADAATFNINPGSTIPATAVLTANGTVNAKDTTLPIATLNGSGTLNAGAVSVSNGGAFSGVFNNGVSTGSLALSGGTLTLSGVNTYSGGTQVTGGNLALSVTGALPVNTALTIGPGGKVSLTNHGVGPKVVLQTSSLSNSGKLDLSNNDLIAFNSAASLSTIIGQLKTGFAAGTGYWNGAAGIVSTAAAGDTRFLTTLGYRVGGSVFDGVSTTSSDVIVKYTYYGDADLNGTLDGGDYHQLDLGLAGHLTGWSNGDFNYDGVVNGADYALLDNTFNQVAATGASPLALIASPSAVSSVPEPTSLALLGIAAMGLVTRSRRRTGR